jgi:hypothetical protein
MVGLDRVRTMSQESFMKRDCGSGLESGQGLTTSQVGDAGLLEEHSNLGYPGGLLQGSEPILRALLSKRFCMCAGAERNLLVECEVEPM